MKQLKLTLYFCLVIHAPLTVAQICNPHITADAPDSRYNVNTNGTVLDKKTALIWMRCALGQTWNNNSCTGSAKGYTWKNALKSADSAVLAGKEDWRLPNQKELQSLIEYRCIEPAMNQTAFPNAITGEIIGNYFWSSSPFTSEEGSQAWALQFSFGSFFMTNKINLYSVRLVRSGQ